MKTIDLHRHIEGAVRPKTIYELLQPQSEFDEFIRTMQVDGTEKTLLDFILKLGTKYMKQVVKGTAELERFGYEAVEDGYSDNLAYLELRACPLPICQTINTISIRDYLKSVRAGMKRAENQYGIKSNLIVSIKREDTFEENNRLVDEILKAYNDGLICGADLCGNEPAYPTINYEPLFERLSKAGVPITIHAGEADTSKSIWDAIEIGATRIGHATNLFTDEELINEVRKRKLGLECCVTSNLHTRAIDSISNHPIKKYLEKDLLVTFNTDDPVTSNITHCSETGILIDELGVNEDTLRRMTENAIEIAFLSEEEKAVLRKKFEE